MLAGSQPLLAAQKQTGGNGYLFYAMQDISHEPTRNIEADLQHTFPQVCVWVCARACVCVRVCVCLCVCVCP